MSKWSVPLDKLAEKVKADMETIVRKATLDVFSSVVNLSPVGNPELWAANEQAGVGVSMREIYRETAQAYNEANPGKRRISVSRAAVEKALPLVAGKGYVGGRFRANWNVTYGVIDRTVTDSVQKERGDAEVQKVLTLPVGGVVYISNSVPYALRLENGWSSQAPAGMVRLSALQWARAVRKASQ